MFELLVHLQNQYMDILLEQCDRQVFQNIRVFFEKNWTNEYSAFRDNCF